MATKDPTQTGHVLALCQGEGEAFLHFDLAGLDVLLQRLQLIREKLLAGECEHDHLMTKSWGDDLLTEELGSVSENKKLVHHMKLFGWTDEWVSKHGLK